MKSSWETTKVDGNTMRLYIAAPDGPEPFPGVIVIQHRDGVDGFVEEMTKRVATAGYFAAALDLYHRDAPDCKDDGATRMTRLRDANVIKDVNAAIDFLKGHRSVQAQKLGIVGFCMGGRVAYLMAAASKEFKAAISWYGGSCFRPWGEAPTPFERTAEINCPIQGHFGETDQNPTLEDMAKIAAELTKQGKAHDFYVYKDTGHSFMDRHHPDKYVALSDRESWARGLEFLRKHLAVQ